jgi:hypothetical protein
LAKSASPRLLAGAMLVGVLIADGAGTFVFAQVAVKTKGPPDLSSNNAGWTSIGNEGGEFIAAPGSPSPVTNDPAHPFVPNGLGKQPTFRVAAIENPNLTQFARDGLRQANEDVLRGKAVFSRESRCWPSGVPDYLLNPGPTFFVQTPEKIAIIWQMDHQVRHIYLNVPHSANPQPSWYGESVGRYEGDTLVVDTIGQNSRTYIDNFRTPHSEKLHVIERYHLVNENTLEAEVTIEDPAVFIEPVRLIHRWRRVQGPMVESTCAEGEANNPFQHEVEPIPIADRPDF